MTRTKGGKVSKPKPSPEQKVMGNRILAVDSLIREGNYPNAATIARKLEVTQRTIQRWVLGQGHTVKVLGPAELVGMVKEEVERVRRMYE
jgi:predicted DNA-binding transcriptional regulator YafY